MHPPYRLFPTGQQPLKACAVAALLPGAAVPVSDDTACSIFCARYANRMRMSGNLALLKYRVSFREPISLLFGDGE